MIIAANFKTFKTRQETLDYYRDVKTFIEKNEISVETMIFPPATALNTFRGETVVGAQNAYPVVNGAYTGEIGLNQLKEFGIETILIGHSERRHVLGESQALMVQKFNFFKEQGFTIVYCIGEPLEVREEGNEALMAYLDAQLEGIDLNYEDLVIAYEPVWAIGTGKTATAAQAQEMHAFIRGLVEEKYGKEVAENTTILYGGSCNAANAKELFANPDVDGGLIGGASLKADDFVAIANSF